MSLSTHELIGRILNPQPGPPSASPLPSAPPGNVREMIGRMIAPQWRRNDAPTEQPLAAPTQTTVPPVASP